MDTNLILPEEFYVSYFYTGSSVICNPPVTNTDIDIMFLTDNIKDFEQELLEDGWYSCSMEEYNETEDSCWRAYRKGKLNYLFTDNKEYYDQFLAATLEATKQNLLKKEDRIALFETYLNKFKKDLTPKQKESIIKTSKKIKINSIGEAPVYDRYGANRLIIQPYQYYYLTSSSSF